MKNKLYKLIIRTKSESPHNGDISYDEDIYITLGKVPESKRGIFEFGTSYYILEPSGIKHLNLSIKYGNYTEIIEEKILALDKKTLERMKLLLIKEEKEETDKYRKKIKEFLKIEKLLGL